ncbi:hypothetical protein CDAR_120071 [Caerostris darwini]|uniref:Uncharacterized protein n=1 Tax=Caerostris darwini TaxID=1538125 RepID=A0AAV4SBM2_9ARAC|nr:hypothetical protein CDAR_120071 [Caerostris darwini]
MQIGIMIFEMAEGMKKMSEEELYESLKSLNVPICRSEFKIPTKDYIIRIFEHFLKDTQIDIEHPVLLNVNLNIMQRRRKKRKKLYFIFRTKENHKNIELSCCTSEDVFFVKRATFQTVIESFNKEKIKYVELLELNKELEEKPTHFYKS